MPDTLTYVFNPVGQGLFAAGAICTEQGKKFTWVYDCGSTTNKSQYFFVDTINKSNQVCSFDDEIDFLVISHFHDDHINGIKYFNHAGINNIKNIIIPYVPFIQRIVTISNDNIDELDDESIRFIVSPYEYLLGIFPESQITLVDFSGDAPGETAASVEGEDINFRTQDIQVDDFQGEFQVSPRRTRLLSSHENTIFGKWKFVFYNKKIQWFDNFYSRNASQIDEHLQIIKNSHEVESKKNSINILRELYRREARQDNINLNETSLAMLVRDAAPMRKILFDVEFSLTYDPFYNNYSFLHPYDFEGNILYTGDINIKDCSDMNAFIDYFSLRNIRLITLQVMHHGSKYNCHCDFPQIVSPLNSIICAKPTARYRHPHKELLDYFSGKHIRVVNSKGVIFFMQYI